MTNKEWYDDNNLNRPGEFEKDCLREKKGSFISKLFKFILICLICFIALEIVVRITGYSERYIYDPIYAPCPGVSSDKIPYIHKPSLLKARGRGFAKVFTDSMGLRCDTNQVTRNLSQKQPGEYRIAVIGDSITFGEGIEDYRDTYCAVLEKNLNNEMQQDLEFKKACAEQKIKKFTVVNFGVSAYNVNSMLATYLYRVSKVKPDLVLFSVIFEDWNLDRTPVLDKYGYTNNSSSSKGLLSSPRLKVFLRKFHSLYLMRDLYRKISSGKDYQKCGYKEIDNGTTREFMEKAMKNGDDFAITILPVYGRCLALPPKVIVCDSHVFNLQQIGQNLKRKQFQTSAFDGHPSAMVHSLIAEELANKIIVRIIEGQNLKRPKKMSDLQNEEMKKAYKLLKNSSGTSIFEL